MWLGSVKLFYCIGIWLVCFSGLIGSEDIITKAMRNRFFRLISKVSLPAFLLSASVIRIEVFRYYYIYNSYFFNYYFNNYILFIFYTNLILIIHICFF